MDKAIEQGDAQDNAAPSAAVPPDGAVTQQRSPPAAPVPSRRKRLGKLARTHALVALAALSLFAAADSWNTVTGLALAGLLCIVTGALAGVTLTTLVHEWFHLLGARYAGAAYDIPTRQSLFVYDWDFHANTPRQFLVMSVAGTVGGLLAVLLLWTAVPADTWGRAALRGGAIASVVFAAFIEWPVIKRVRGGADPLGELSKIDQPLLSRSFNAAGIAGIVMTLLLVA
ncbi:MAG: hypothetical protein R3E50_05180 [Halioglobus sp.]